MSSVRPQRDPTGPNHLERQVEKDQRTREALASILRVSLEPIPLAEQVHRILDLILRISWLSTEPRGCVYLSQGEPPTLVMTAHSGIPEAVRLSRRRLAPGQCLCAEATNPGSLPCAERVGHCRATVYNDAAPHGHYCVPVTHGDERIGLLILALREGHERADDEECFLRAVADVIAGVVVCKSVEESLRRSEERFELAVRGTDAGIWDWDLRTNAVYFSPRWKSILGYEESEINGSFTEWEARLHPDDRFHAFATVRNYLEGRTPHYELEHRLLHKDGSYRWIVARGAMVSDPAGRPYRMVGSHLDVTDRKRVEEQLRHREADLIAARKILERLLPHASLHANGVEVHGVSFAADYASGDHFDYFSLPDGTILAVVADVCGHGIDAALLMTMTHAWLRSLAGLGLDVGEILTRLNAVLIEQTDGDRFVTLLAARIDPQAMTLVFAGAGHPPGYVLGKSGAPRSTLDSTSAPLVVKADETFSTAGPVALEHGDLVLLATDGITEARSPHGELFGTDRMLLAVRERIDRPNEAILKGLRDAIRRFTGTDELADDVTAVLLRVR